MSNRLCSKAWVRWDRTSRFGLLCLALVFAGAPRGVAGDAPSWLHALAAAPLPKYPPETGAVQLLEDRVVAVNENGETRTTYRRAYKILRQSGRDYASVVIPYDSETRVSSLRGWCIPAQGKDYEVKDKDALEMNLTEGALFADERRKVLVIPAADPGSVIGYEYEQKARPYIHHEIWWFQDVHPVREARFSLQLPQGWEFKAYWVNHAEVKPVAGPNNQWQWQLTDIPAVQEEPVMPPPQAIEARMIVVYLPGNPASRQKAYDSWLELGNWYEQLAASRRGATPEIRQKVAALTASASSTLERIRALAAFVQREVRYVAIEIGIGGMQPHAAQDVFSNRYGDCKDKATLLATMLKEIGVDSFHVVIHTRRGVVLPEYPPALNFNHAILAIRLPADVPDKDLYAVVKHERLGRLLFFDPTSSLTPLGYLPSPLQANYGLVATDKGGELMRLPLLPPNTNQLTRTAKLRLSPTGTLAGDVEEIRSGQPAERRRGDLLAAQASDRAKVLENFLSDSLGGFQLTKASVGNLELYDSALTLHYSFTAENYAKAIGNLLLIRPRVLGQKGSNLLEIKERKYPVEYSEATRHSDSFEIALPAGYEVDELPPPVSVDYGFASYQSKVEVTGGTLRYTRTFQIKDVFVPTKNLDQLKRFYRQIAADEQTSAVLRSSSH